MSRWARARCTYNSYTLGRTIFNSRAGCACAVRESLLHGLYLQLDCVEVSVVSQIHPASHEVESPLQHTGRPSRGQVELPLGPLGPWVQPGLSSSWVRGLSLAGLGPEFFALAFALAFFGLDFVLGFGLAFASASLATLACLLADCRLSTSACLFPLLAVGTFASAPSPAPAPWIKPLAARAARAWMHARLSLAF